MTPLSRRSDGRIGRRDAGQWHDFIVSKTGWKRSRVSP